MNLKKNVAGSPKHEATMGRLHFFPFIPTEPLSRQQTTKCFHMCDLFRSMIAEAVRK